MEFVGCGCMIILFSVINSYAFVVRNWWSSVRQYVLFIKLLIGFLLNSILAAHSKRFMVSLLSPLIGSISLRYMEVKSKFIKFVLRTICTQHLHVNIKRIWRNKGIFCASVQRNIYCRVVLMTTERVTMRRTIQLVNFINNKGTW